MNGSSSLPRAARRATRLWLVLCGGSLLACCHHPPRVQSQQRVAQQQHLTRTSQDHLWRLWSSDSTELETSGELLLYPQVIPPPAPDSTSARPSPLRVVYHQRQQVRHHSSQMLRDSLQRHTLQQDSLREVSHVIHRPMTSPLGFLSSLPPFLWGLGLGIALTYIYLLNKRNQP